jgi:hypothetical protein
MIEKEIQRRALRLFGVWWERPQKPLRVAGGVILDGMLRRAAQR